MSQVSNHPPIVCFLLGLPRSGTTLLAHLLQQHPDITAPPEPWLMLALDALGKVDRSHPADAAFVGMATNEFFGRIDRAAACRALSDAAYGQYLAAAGKRCFIDKTPRYWMAVDFIDTLYPEALRIVLLRNPYAIAASLKSTWSITLLPEGCSPAHSSHLADLVLGLPVLAARRDHPKTEVIRYEALVAQPVAEVRRLVAALGHDPAGITSTTMEKTDYLKSGNFGDRKILEKKTVDDRSIDAWRSELSLEEMQAVTDMVGAELLIALGYEQELQRAQEAGVVDKGEHVTKRHRQMFEAWWTLRNGRKAAAAIGEPALAEQQSDAATLAETESGTSAPDLSTMQTARILAESDTERALRQANAATDELQQALAASEADRAARLNIIHEQNATIATLQSEVARLGQTLAVSEADRAARLDASHEQNATIATLQGEVARLGQTLAVSEADRAARLDVIHEQNAAIATLQSEVARLGQTLAVSEADRAARLDVIHEQNAAIATLQSEVARLGQTLAVSEADRAARLDAIHEQNATIAALQSEVARLGQTLAVSEADRAARLDVIHQRDAALATLQAEKALLEQTLAESEADRAARLAVIKQHEATIGDVQAEIAKLDAMITELNAVQETVLGSRWWRIGAQLRLTPFNQLSQF